MTYAAGLGFALVYLGEHRGEHYVIDLLAGGSLALLVAALERPLTPTARRVDRLWRRLDPKVTLDPARLVTQTAPTR